MDGLYVHIPFCSSKCDYCNFCSGIADDETVLRYVDRVIEELTARKKEVGTLDSIYFGGGTPGVLPVELFAKLTDAIAKNYSIDSRAEITFETNPDTVPRYADTLKALGVNRISMGVQATQDRLLKSVGRKHTYSEFETAIDSLVRVGIGNVSVDLMIGLPDQTSDDVAESLARLEPYPLKHYSVYGLKVEEGTPLFARGFQTDENLEADFYGLAVRMLSDGGFVRYETSNFSKPGFECRHNLKYWTLEPYLGVGVSAHSDTCGRRARHGNSLVAYMTRDDLESDPIDEAEREEETVMLGLRLEQGVDTVAFEKRFGHRLESGREDAVRRLVAQGVLIFKGGRMRLAPQYAYVANSVLVQLL